MNKLEEICAKKREHIEAQKTKTPFDDLKYKVADMPPPRGFIGKLMTSQGPALIAEIKKASPSQGIIRPDFEPVSIASIYENAGASCLSVLTDEPYFKGSDADLVNVKEKTTLPVLRKDFILDPYQVYESRALGADCILLIIAALTKSEAQKLYDTASELRMDVLVEIHDKAELDVALKINPLMIGVNNRDLTTLKTDLNTSRDLAPLIPGHILKIAESGIDGHEALMDLKTRGYSGFLVGESLLRQENISQAVKELLGK